MPKITVYRYELFDAATSRYRKGPGYGTLEGIESKNGLPIREEYIQVDTKQLDEHGFFRQRAR